MKKNKKSLTLIHGIDCTKNITVAGILGRDGKNLYLETEEGVEVDLSILLAQFEDNTVVLNVTSEEEVII